MLTIRLFGHAGFEIDGEEFPHLMLWARARAALATGDRATAAAHIAGARRLYDERVAAVGPHVAAYEAVPWNARFREARTTFV